MEIPLEITRWVGARTLRQDLAWDAADDPDYIMGRQHGRSPERLGIPQAVERHFGFLAGLGFDILAGEKMMELRARAYRRGDVGVLVGTDLDSLYVVVGPVRRAAASTGEVVDDLIAVNASDDRAIAQFGLFPLIAGEPDDAAALVARHATAFRRVTQRDLRGAVDTAALRSACDAELARLRPAPRVHTPTSERERVELMLARGQYAELHAELDAAAIRLRDGEATAAGTVLAYLAIDPWYFRSGYRKGRLCRALTHVRLDANDRATLHELAVRWLDGDLYNSGVDFCRVAGRNANNSLRRMAVAQLQRPRDAAWPALKLILEIRRPGLTPRARERIRDLSIGAPVWKARRIARRLSDK